MFENTMEAIVNTLAAARLSKDSDNPQVFEVHFELQGFGYSSRGDLHRLVFDPRHMGDDKHFGDTFFLYKGEGFFDKLVGMVDVQKNGKGIVVKDYFFNKKMTQTLNDEHMKFVKVIHFDADVPENYNKVVEEVEEELPF